MFFVIIATSLLYFNYVLAERNTETYCSDQKIQEHIDISQLTGMWFAVEIISHLQENTPTSSYEEIQYDHESCAVVTISDRPNAPLSPMYTNFSKYDRTYGPKYTVYQQHDMSTERSGYQYYNYRNRPRDYKHKQQNYSKFLNDYIERKHISISWDEDYTTTVYAAYYTFPVGLWNIYQPFIDSQPPEENSTHLVGNIQVLKAVGTHVVLTFCLRWPEQKFYTVILSRSPKLRKEDLSGVYNLLRRLELDFAKRRKLCLLNNSGQFSLNYLVILLNLIFATYTAFL